MTFMNDTEISTEKRSKGYVTGNTALARIMQVSFSILLKQFKQ